MPENTDFTCLNCGKENDLDFNYCSECGQKNRPLKVKIWEFITEFFDSVFNLNSKFFKTISKIFIPGKLTKEFFLGKRVNYYHPLRMYIVSIIFLFAVLSVMKVDDVFNITGLDLSQNIEKRVQLDEQIKTLNTTIDSFKLEHQESQNLSVIDSLQKRLYLLNSDNKIYLNDSLKSDTTSFKLTITEVKLSSQNLFVNSIDTVVENSGLANWVEKLMLRQFIKGARDFKSLNKFIYANLTWLLLSLIPVFALILKLIYIRRKRYFLEHFVFLLHLFTALIYFGLFALLMSKNEVLFYPSVAFIGIVVLLFPFLAFKLYYNQGFMKTLIKYIINGFLFTLSFFICLLFFFLITAAFF